MASFQITPSDQQAEYLRRKVESGEFATEAAVIQESLSVLQQEDEELETWFREVGGPIYDRMKADPSRAIPFDDVVSRLEERRRLRAKTA